MTQKKTLPNQKGSIKVSQECQIQTPAEWRGFFINEKDWKRIKKMLNNIKPVSSTWQIIGSALIGGALTSLIGYFTILEKGHPNKTLCLWLFILFAVVGILCFVVYKKDKEALVFTKDQLKDELKEIEQEYASNEKYGKFSNLSNEENHELKIIKAEYKTQKESSDITEKLNQKIENDMLEITASNDIFGDPDPGTEKILEIKYTYKGEVHMATFNENDSITLP